MAEDNLTLEALKSQFLDQYKDEYLFQFFEMIYDKYLQEFLIKFDPFYKELLESFNPTNEKEIERNLFEVDFMINICDYLNLIFLLNKLSFEQITLEMEEAPGVAFIYFNSQEEKVHKEKMIRNKSKTENLEFYTIYMDLNLVGSKIDSIMLMPSTIVDMTKSKSDSMSKVYKEKIDVMKNKMKKLESDAKHGRKFKGKPLSSEKEQMYKNILSIQNELIDEFGLGHSSSLTQSVRIYSQRNKCYWDDKKIGSIAETVRILRIKGAI